MIYPTGLLQPVLKNRSSRFVAGFMSLALATVSTFLIPSLARAGHPNPPPPPIVLVFPFINNAGAAYDALAPEISGSVRIKIDSLGYYRATGYSVLNPSIQRALNVEDTISVADLSAPTASPDTAEKIEKLVGAPYYLDGNIDSITTDATSGTVTVQLDGTFYETDTGAVVKQATVTGTAAPSSKVYDPAQIQASAIDNATGNLIGTVVGPQFSKQEAGTVVSAGNKNNSSRFGAGLLIGLAIILALVLINNHGGHGGSAPSSNGTSGGTGSGTTTTTTTTGGTTGIIAPPSPPNN